MINEFCSLGDVKTIAIMKSPKIAQFEAKNPDADEWQIADFNSTVHYWKNT